MGGAVGFTIRESDGTEHRMCRFTNYLPWYIVNKKMLDKDPEHLKFYTDSWKDLRKEAEEDPECFQARMYGNYPYLAPTGYGLIVVDWQKDVIVSMQNYSTFNRITYTAAKLDIDGFDDDPESDAHRLRELYEAGKVHPEVLDNKGNAMVKFNSVKELRALFNDPSEAWRYEISELMRKNGWQIGKFSTEDKKRIVDLDFLLKSYENRPNDLTWGKFEIDMSPFEYIDLGDKTADNMVEFRRMLVEDLDFVLTEKEEELWEEEIKEHRKYEEE
jgi:hypothetical protein